MVYSSCSALSTASMSAASVASSKSLSELAGSIRRRLEGEMNCASHVDILFLSSHIKKFKLERIFKLSFK